MFTSKAEALVSYAAERLEEIDLLKGDILLVDETSLSNGWMFAQSHGKAGLVRADCIRIVGKGTTITPLFFLFSFFFLFFFF